MQLDLVSNGVLLSCRNKLINYSWICNDAGCKISNIGSSFDFEFGEIKLSSKFESTRRAIVLQLLGQIDLISVRQ